MITIDEKTGDLYASGQVRSTLPFEQIDSKTRQPTKVTSIASSKDLHYEDALRRATYTTDAHITGPQGDLRGVTEGLSLLRLVGLDGVARRTALELMILERRG